MISFVKHLVKYFRIKCKFAKKCRFDLSCSISAVSEFEGMNKLHKNVSFSGYLGYGSYIGPNCCLNAHIGRFCSIAPNVSCNSGVHPYKPPYVSTAPCFYSLNPSKAQNGATFAKNQVFDEFRYFDQEKKYAVQIENDVWICEGAFLNPGIQISNGAVVLAHAVVTKSVPPYAIVGGVPAKVLGYRYDESTIKWLLDIKWWENDEKWFKKNWMLMNDIKKLYAYYNSRVL